MKFSEKIDLRDDSGIVLNNHPPVIVSLDIAKSSTGLIPAGCVLGKDHGNYTNHTTVKEVVLLEDVSQGTGAVMARCLVHGCVNANRVFDSIEDRTLQQETSKTLIARGIYPIQSFDE